MSIRDTLEERHFLPLRDEKRRKSQENTRRYVDRCIRREVSRSIEEEKPAHVHFIEHSVARLFWDIIQLEEEKREAEIEAERRIKAERDNTARILDGLGEAVIVLNEDHIIKHANQTFLKEFGSDHTPVIGKNEELFFESRPGEGTTFILLLPER